MLILLSSSKTQDITTNTISNLSAPIFKKQTQEILKTYQTYSQKKIKELMKTNDVLTKSTFENFKNFDNQTIKKAALSMYTGAVYRPFNINTFTKKDFSFAQNHIYILSGLYGLLRPLDQIKPYRLEMKFTHKIWKQPLTSHLKKDNKKIINLASKESTLALDLKLLSSQIVTPVFKEDKNGTLKSIATYAKMARGEMANWIIKNNIESIDEVKKFTITGYVFDQNLSSDSEFVFVRKHDL